MTAYPFCISAFAIQFERYDFPVPAVPLKRMFPCSNSKFVTRFLDAFSASIKWVSSSPV